jgi:hypothetical protein
MASKKISQFTTQSLLSDSDLFTLVRNSTNLNISYTDFKSELGVTGSIEQVGDPLGAPVLYVDGDAYGIRNIESGAGVSASISAQNGVVLKLNVTQDATGTAIINDLTANTPVLSSFVSGQGISITKADNAITVSNTIDPATGLSNRVVVTQASDLAGALDSTKEYFIDGVINMSSQSIEIPSGGLYLTGYNFDTSRLFSSAENYTMFTSPVVGSGNVIGRDYAVEVTGANSQVYDIFSLTGFDAFEFTRINYNNCESLGTITRYRQGLEVGTGRFGGKPQLTLAGTWVGGYLVDTSIVRSLDDGVYSLFSAGAGFSMASRFRTNMNVDLPANASLFDFSDSQFPNPSTVQVDGAIVTREGVFNANDSNITPNILSSDLSCQWMGNTGMPNTFEGGSIGVTTESVTTITTPGVFVDIAAASWTSADLQHFDNPVDGQLRHLGNTPREFKVIADFLLDSSSGDDLTLRVVRWDDSASSFVTVLDQTREVNNFQGGRDLAFFNININTVLDQNDYIKLQVANVAATNNVTAEADSYYIVEAR